MAQPTSQATSLLRFIACGSVDDGKSTLLGRLLYDCHAVPEDQLATLARDSRNHRAGAEVLDFSLITDGLAAEREQGITIDVAYRYFHTPRRSFIVADCPGHEQYTRNMVTGASQADLAVMLVDASKGLLTQTYRHAYLCSLLGIGQVILAVNKMDRVGYDRAVFERIAEDFRELTTRLGWSDAQVLPVVAPHGENVSRSSDNMPWYRGPSLLTMLESAEVTPSPGTHFRMPVQWVNRLEETRRGYAGTISAGTVMPGDEIVVQPSAERARVQSILASGGELQRAEAGMAVLLLLDREIDVGRGDVLAQASRPAPVADQFAAHLVWMSEEPLLPHRSYVLKLGTRMVDARVSAIKHKIDVDNGAELAARRLSLNDVAYVTLDLGQPVPFETYRENRELGGFILIDRHSHATVGCGMLDFALRRAGNVHWQHLDLDKQARSHSKGQRAHCLWLTGLSGAGKSSIANAAERQLHARGMHTYVLDGDNLRHGLNRDLGFTAEARVENVRRVAEVARLMVDAGLVVLVCVISPFASEREFARSLFEEGEFSEVFVDTSLIECERRDPKGLYRKARAGEIINFTGIDAPYEAPTRPELHLYSTGLSIEQQAEKVVDHLWSVQVS